MKQKDNTTAYILLSGGQDSFVCLIWALANFEKVETISIAYSQKHAKELEYAARIAKHFGVKHTVYDIAHFMSAIAQSSLSSDENHNQKHAQASRLPASFVPNRNGLFLTIIANHAFKNNEKRIELVTGTCETDFSASQGILAASCDSSERGG